MENFIKEVEVDGVSHSITLGDNMVGFGLKKDENGVVSLDINEEKLVKITYSELKTLKDGSQLVQGTFYRITDYVTTTTQSETKSANHPFDVIVLALSENTLCEDAKAILHEGDTYFADSDLSAWELKYCLDNDKTRFAWADETNGKGVIYRMVDEKSNDCPYDFKNILFYNTKLISSNRYYYTFSYEIAGMLYDGTTAKQVKYCYGNVMGKYRISGVLTLNNNVFRNMHFSDSCYSNTFGNNCYSNSFERSCGYNTFGNFCHDNTFENSLKNCSLDSDNTSITLNEEFYDDGSGQVVPVKHPDLSTQPSILPYKFMGRYVYEQLIPNIKLDALVNTETYFSPNLGLAVKESPYVISANAIIKTDFGVLTVPITTYIEYSVIRFKLNVAMISGDFGELGNSLLCQIHIIYTSMPEDSGYYGYNN